MRAPEEPRIVVRWSHPLLLHRACGRADYNGQSREGKAGLNCLLCVPPTARYYSVGLPCGVAWTAQRSPSQRSGRPGPVVCASVWRRGWGGTAGCVRGLQARGQRRRGPGEVKVVGWRGTIGYGGPGGHVSGVTCRRRVDEVWGRSRCRGGGAAGGRSLGGLRARGFVGDRGLGSGRRIRSYHTKEAVLRRESCCFVVSFFLVLYVQSCS